MQSQDPRLFKNNQHPGEKLMMDEGLFWNVTLTNTATDLSVRDDRLIIIIITLSTYY